MTATTQATVLRGAGPAAEIRAAARVRIQRFVDRGVVPRLAIVTVGEPPAGNPYVRAKCTAAEELGASASVTRLAADADEGTVRDTLHSLSESRGVHGIILQFPLPPHLREERFLDVIDPRQDVDGVHPLNVGRWVNGLRAHRPATPLGVIELLRRQCGDLSGRGVVVIGRSRIVGRPLSVLLSQREPGLNATVTLCHSGTRDLPAITRGAEILVVAMGRRRAVTAEFVRPGAVVIDVGIHPVAGAAPGAPRYEGDVDFESVRAVASAVTPVPGGVGPMTVAMLLRNFADAVEWIEGDA